MLVRRALKHKFKTLHEESYGHNKLKSKSSKNHLVNTRQRTVYLSCKFQAFDDP